MKKYTFLNFLNKKEIREGFLSNIALAGALAGSSSNGDTGEIENLKPQQLKISQEQIREKYKLSDEESKIFLALKEKGMKDFYMRYLINFFKNNKGVAEELKNFDSLKNIIVPRRDIDFYRVLKSGNVIHSFDLDEMKKEKPMTKEEERILYGMANDWFKHLASNAFGFGDWLQNKEIYLSNDLLKFLVFNEKYKFDNDIGTGDIKEFLEKYKINWGDIDGMRKVMKNYHDVLENYKNRKP